MLDDGFYLSEGRRHERSTQSSRLEHDHPGLGHLPFGRALLPGDDVEHHSADVEPAARTAVGADLPARAAATGDSARHAHPSQDCPARSHRPGYADDSRSHSAAAEPDDAVT